MKILFIHESLATGGIETMVLRLSRMLARDGHAVALLTSRRVENPLLRDFLKVGRAFFVNDGPFPVSTFRVTRPLSKAIAEERFDYFFCLNGASMLVGFTLASDSPTTKVMVGVYHPREYCSKHVRKRFRQRWVERLLLQVPPQNVIFMNEATRQQNAACLGASFASSPIVPIPIDAARFERVSRAPVRGRIVSVGRLADFKTYNRELIPVVAELRRTGYSIEYHIFGDGATKPELEGVNRREGGGTVFRGEIPYHELEQAFAQASVFVGMGTALLEAAAAGTPSLVAVDSLDSPQTYGWFCEVGHLSTGERVAVPLESFKGELQAVLDGTRDPEECGKRCRATAQLFAAEYVFPSLLKALERAAPFGAALARWDRAHYVLDTIKWRILSSLGFQDPQRHRYLEPKPHPDAQQPSHQGGAGGR